jgi:hypothetical protein
MKAPQPRSAVGGTPGMVNERDRDVTEGINGLDVEPDVESGRRSMTTTYSNRTSEASEVEYVGKTTRHGSSSGGSDCVVDCAC